jgi:hypothetical protein
MEINGNHKRPDADIAAALGQLRRQQPQRSPIPGIEAQ